MALEGKAGRCYACDRALNVPHGVYTSDLQMVWIGPECARKVKRAGAEGYQPPLGGPRLYSVRPE